MIILKFRRNGKDYKEKPYEETYSTVDDALIRLKSLASGNKGQFRENTGIHFLGFANGNPQSDPKEIETLAEFAEAMYLNEDVTTAHNRIKDKIRKLKKVK